MKRVYALGTWLSAYGLMMLAASCASAPPAAAFSPELAPSAVATTSQAEQELLLQAQTLPVDQPVEVAGLHVLAGAPYSAASGRVCRELRVDEQTRLVCDGETGWLFVPVLLEGP